MEITTGPVIPDKVHCCMKEMSLDPNPINTNHDCVRCNRCREYDHFASECPNMPTDEEPEYDNADPASLHLMTRDHYPIDSEEEIEYLNL